MLLSPFLMEYPASTIPVLFPHTRCFLCCSEQTGQKAFDGVGAHPSIIRTQLSLALRWEVSHFGSYIPFDLSKAMRQHELWSQGN